MVMMAILAFVLGDWLADWLTPKFQEEMVIPPL
jgi:hypothetical protein